MYLVHVSEKDLVRYHRSRLAAVVVVLVAFAVFAVFAPEVDPKIHAPEVAAVAQEGAAGE
jgi:uncharacterized membrane protein YjfL (UPF0719 family)